MEKIFAPSRIDDGVFAETTTQADRCSLYRTLYLGNMLLYVRTFYYGFCWITGSNTCVSPLGEWKSRMVSWIMDPGSSPLSCTAFICYSSEV